MTVFYKMRRISWLATVSFLRRSMQHGIIYLKVLYIWAPSVLGDGNIFEVAILRSSNLLSQLWSECPCTPPPPPPATCFYSIYFVGLGWGGGVSFVEIFNILPRVWGVAVYAGVSKRWRCYCADIRLEVYSIVFVSMWLVYPPLLWISCGGHNLPSSPASTRGE
jgi:hypothetical protein